MRGREGAVGTEAGQPNSSRSTSVVACSNGPTLGEVRYPGRRSPATLKRTHLAANSALMQMGGRRSEGTMDPVRIERERDQQTLAIGTALGLFTALMLAALLVLGLRYSLSDVVDPHVDVFIGWAFAVAGIVAIANLVRSTKR
jgi:hypothetical protein